MYDLNNKSFCIFGLPDSGKSTLANRILDSFGEKGFVYDTLNEYPDTPFDSYAPKGRYDVKEFQTVLRAVMNKGFFKLILIDEANRFCPSKPAPLPQAVADLNDWRAHWQVSVGFIARRPVQLNQDLTELSNFLFIFGLKGKNDIQYLNDISAGLGDLVSKIPVYHFVAVDAARNYELMAPVEKRYITAKTRVKPRT